MDTKFSIQNLGLRGHCTKSWACKHRGACSSPGDHPIQAEMPKDKTLSKFSIQKFSLGSQLRLCLFLEIYFLKNYFLNFPVFICY